MFGATSEDFLSASFIGEGNTGGGEILSETLLSTVVAAVVGVVEASTIVGAVEVVAGTAVLDDDRNCTAGGGGTTSCASSAKEFAENTDKTMYKNETFQFVILRSPSSYSSAYFTK
jgi:hypothetical protein